jgi:hypothetical protein
LFVRQKRPGPGGGKPEIDFCGFEASPVQNPQDREANGASVWTEGGYEGQMTGWISVFLIAIALITAAVVLIRRAAGRWWDYLLIVALAALLFRPLYTLVSGDVSRYLPAFLWSDGSDGKDQIIWASIASTFLLPLVLSALVLMIAKWVWRISRR